MDRWTVAEKRAEELSEIEGVYVGFDSFEPSTDESIAQVSARLGWAVPEEVAALWRRGYRAWSGSVDGDTFLAIGWDFMEPPYALRELDAARNLAAEHWAGGAPPDEPETERFVALLRDGLPVSYANPCVFVDRHGEAFLVNYKDCRADALGALGAFVDDWAQSGFLRQCDAEGTWAAWRARLGLAGPNRWADLYRRLYWS